MKALHTIAFILVIIGALNWLVLGVTPSGWDVGQIFGGQMATVSRIIYILVGLSGIVLIFDHKRTCRQCMSDTSGSSM